MTILNSPYQHTVRSAVSSSGVALHTGENVTMTIRPADINTGIIFRRIDVKTAQQDIPARYDNVTGTNLGTVIENRYGHKVSTIEHVMAALWGCGIDNAIIDIDGPEVPVMDGSSEPFVFLIECAGVEEQDAPRRYIEVNRVITVEQGNSIATIAPSDNTSLDITIRFDHDKIGTQHAIYDFTHTSFKQTLCRARTFGFSKDVETLRKMGLARGGSLENAVVLDDAKILNADGLRYDDEFVRHKALDCMGDYFLGGFIKAEFTTCCPGHGINNLLMRALFANPENYTIRDLPVEHMPIPTVVEALPMAATA